MDAVTYKLEQFEGPLDLLLTLIQKNKDLTRIENYRPILMNTSGQTFNKIFTNQIRQYIKRIIYHDQMGLMEDMHGWFKI